MCGETLSELFLTPKGNLSLQGMSNVAEGLTGFAAARAARDEANIRADLSQYKAGDIRRRGATEEMRRRREGRRQVGSQRAVLAGRNLDLTEGTPADILRGTELIAEMDALTIRDEVARDAGLAEFGVELQRNSAKQISPFLEGAGPLLASSAKTLRSKAAFKKVGG